MKRFLTLFVLLLAGCGFVPSESRLVGTWQVDSPAPQKLVYAFQKDYTYSMSIGGQAGAMQGTWKLDGSLLTMTLRSFAAYGMTNPLPILTGASTQKNVIVRVSDSAMVWRGGVFGSGLKLKRLKTPAGPIPP